jgi:hypothetical protein
MTSFDTCFAKIVSDTEGWDHMLIEGTIITLRVGDRDKNNEIVDAIVRGLRAQRGLDHSAQSTNTAAVSAG